MFFGSRSPKSEDTEAIVPKKPVPNEPEPEPEPEPEQEPEPEPSGIGKKSNKLKKPIPKAPAFPEKYRVVNILNDQVLEEVTLERKKGYTQCDKNDLYTKVVKRDGLIDLILNKLDNLKKYSRGVELQLDDASARVRRLKHDRETKDEKILSQDKELFRIGAENEFKKNDTVDMNMIESKCDVYYNLFIRLYDKLTVTKKRLDLYQSYLKRINSVIQLSVITLSIASSFMQALDSKTYEILFKTDNSYDTIVNSTLHSSPSYDGDIEESTYSSTVSIATLSISTYSALVIAAERHFSFQQRETNVEKLKESYTEPINRIRSNLELMRPWRYKSYYMKTRTEFIDDSKYADNKYNESNRSKKEEEWRRTMVGKISESNENDEMRESTESRDEDVEKGDKSTLYFDEDRKKDWISMLGKLDREYSHVVDVKKELDTSLEKMIGVKTMKSYQSSAPRKKREKGLQNIQDMEDYANNSNFIRNIRGCCSCCRCCTHREVNHTYDEDDMNHIEDRLETDELNQKHLSKKD